VIKPNSKGETSFADEILPVSPEEDPELMEEEEAEEVTFGLERDMQLALRNNIGQLESGLKITDGGKERAVEAGYIDITATDVGGNSVVIELKAGMASPAVVAQVLAYMGSVAETDKKPVRGIIVAGDFHKKVILASRAVQNLQLKKYSFQFKFGAP
jgi:RecB family endonuclease NucS